MSKAIDLWLGPDIDVRVTALIQGLVDETLSFGAGEFTEKYYLVSSPLHAVLTRCHGREAWIRCCRKAPRSLAVYAIEVQSAIGIGSLIFSVIDPGEQCHLILLFDDLDCVKWPTQEAELEQIEKTFGESFHFPDWPFLSSLLTDPARN